MFVYSRYLLNVLTAFGLGLPWHTLMNYIAVSGMGGWEERGDKRVKN